MSFGDDYVAARLSIDIPEGSVEGIREITQEVERFRVTMEAATRVETDMTRYLEQMTEAAKAANIAQRELVSTLENYMSVTGRYGGVPGVPPSGVPGGTFQQPFSAQGPGMGASPTRPPNPSDVPTQLGMAQGNSPRGWLNMQHDRGNITAQDVVNISPQSIQDLANKIADREQGARQQLLHSQGLAEPSGPGRQVGGAAGGLVGAEQRVQRATSLAGQVMNELAPGGGVTGLGHLAIQGLNWAGRRSAQAAGRRESNAQAPSSTHPDTLTGNENASGEGGAPTEEMAPSEIAQQAAASGAPGMLSKLGGIGKFLGPIAGVATAALSIFGAIQGGGQLIQGMRNTAAVRGGAAGEGAEVEFKARALAMNPFLTGDQARQIYQTVMSEGYADASGGGADNVIAFMQKNLTDMNIQVADSAKMLRSTIVGSGKGDKESVAAAVEDLRVELDTIRTLSRDSVINTPEYTQKFEALKQQMMAGGATPEGAAQSAIGAMQVGADNQALAGQFANTVSDFQGNDAMGAMAMALGGGSAPRGLLPGAAMGYFSDTGQAPRVTWNVMRTQAQRIARMDKGDPASRRNAVYLFQRLLKQWDPSHAGATNQKAAEAFYLQLLGNEDIKDADQGMSSLPSPNLEVEPLPSASFTPNESPSLPSPSSTAPGTGGGDRSPTISAPPLVGPSASRVSGEATVQISLSPEAARVLQVSNGPNVRVPLSSTKQGANRGFGGYAVNAQGVE